MMLWSCAVLIPVAGSAQLPRDLIQRYPTGLHHIHGRIAPVHGNVYGQVEQGERFREQPFTFRANDQGKGLMSGEVGFSEAFTLVGDLQSDQGISGNSQLL